jgi:hypothetical protein
MAVSVPNKAVFGFWEALSDTLRAYVPATYFVTVSLGTLLAPTPISRKSVYDTDLHCGTPSSFNHLVSAGKERVRNVDGERLGRPKVDGHFKLSCP